MGIMGRGAIYCARVGGGGRNELRPYRKICEISMLKVRSILLFFFFLLLLLPQGRLEAANSTWNIDGNATWSNAAAWAPAAVPASTDDAYFLSVITATRVVRLALTNDIGTITFNDDNVYFFNTPTGGASTTDGYLELNTAGTNFTQSGSAPVIFTASTKIGLMVDSIWIGEGTGAFTNLGVIYGTGALTKEGSFKLILSGIDTNTFTGTMTVNAGTVEMNKRSLNAAYRGSSLIIGDGVGGANADVVALQRNEQIADATDITINSSGLLAVGIRTETIGSLTMTGGSVLVTNGGVFTPGTSVTTLASSTSATIGGDGVTAGTFTASGISYVFNVADGSVADDLVFGLSTPAASFDLLKDGSGTMVLTATNSHTDTTTVRDGVLIVTIDGALGTTAVGTTVSNGGTLGFRGGVTYSTTEALFIAGTGESALGALYNPSGTNSFAGVIALEDNATIFTAADRLTLSTNIDTTVNAYLLTVSNAASSELVVNQIAGSGGLLHTGAGTLTMAGPASSTFTGPITNVAGTIQVDLENWYAGTDLTVSGGTVLFNVASTNTSTAVTLSGGALKESDDNMALGALTLTADSYLVLSSGGSSGGFTFNSGTNTTGSALLIISNWTGVADGTAGTDDRIFFTTAPVANFLNNVQFVGFAAGADLIAGNELVPRRPVPEPATILGGFLLAGLLARKKFAGSGRQ